MATVNVYSYWEASITSARREGGSLDTPVAVVAASNVVHDQTFAITNGSTQEIFDVADDIPDFDFMVVLSDQAVLMQIVVDDGAQNGEAFIVFTLIANLPFIFPSKTALGCRLKTSNN